VYRPTPLKPSDMGADSAAATSAAMAQMACEHLCAGGFPCPQAHVQHPVTELMCPVTLPLAATETLVFQCYPCFVFEPPTTRPPSTPWLLWSMQSSTSTAEMCPQMGPICAWANPDVGRHAACSSTDRGGRFYAERGCQRVAQPGRHRRSQRPDPPTTAARGTSSHLSIGPVPVSSLPVPGA